MAIRGFHYTLSGCVVAALLAGCVLRQAQDDTQPPLATAATMVPNASSSSYKVLYRFSQNEPAADGHPLAGLINVSGTLYGTTYGSLKDDGTVFSISTTGAHKTLHRFQGSHDGDEPMALLLGVNDTLYGTTFYGGSSGYGVVFSVTTAGAENIVHHFAGGSDGAHPQGALIDVNGTLYGNTSNGGGSGCKITSLIVGCGTVYTISASGAENVLYRFSGKPDGSWPTAALLDVNGTLYGVTANGGDSSCGCLGTVYSISAAGAEKVLHSFTGTPDGATPNSPLIDVNGTLYGTTTGGGASGYGTVYSISTAGTEKVLYSFAGGSSDGIDPGRALLDVNGLLYGTTFNGGPTRCDIGGVKGCGTLYSITTGGVEKVLHFFSGSSDGSIPQGDLLNVNGVLYGTTAWGGTSKGHRAGGTVFEITP